MNLNLRSVVADSPGTAGPSAIFDRLVRRLTHEKFWEACRGCDLRDRCYVHHNARTLMDPVAGLEGHGTAARNLRHNPPSGPAAHHDAGPAVGARVHAGRHPGLRPDPLPVRHVRRREPATDPRRLLLQCVAGRGRVGGSTARPVATDRRRRSNQPGPRPRPGLPAAGRA